MRNKTTMMKKAMFSAAGLALAFSLTACDEQGRQGLQAALQSAAQNIDKIGSEKVADSVFRVRGTEYRYFNFTLNKSATLTVNAQGQNGDAFEDVYKRQPIDKPKEKPDISRLAGAMLARPDQGPLFRPNHFNFCAGLVPPQPGWRFGCPRVPVSPPTPPRGWSF